MPDLERDQLNLDIQAALETNLKSVTALPAFNWIDLLTKLVPILIDILKTHETPK